MVTMTRGCKGYLSGRTIKIWAAATSITSLGRQEEVAVDGDLPQEEGASRLGSGARLYDKKKK